MRGGVTAGGGPDRVDGEDGGGRGEADADGGAEPDGEGDGHERALLAQPHADAAQDTGPPGQAGHGAAPARRKPCFLCLVYGQNTRCVAESAESFPTFFGLGWTVRARPKLGCFI